MDLIYKAFATLIILTGVCPILAYAEIVTYKKGKIFLSNVLFLLVNVARAGFLTVVTWIVLYWRI